MPRPLGSRSRALLPGHCWKIASINNCCLSHGEALTSLLLLEPFGLELCRPRKLLFKSLVHKCKLILFFQVSDCSERHQSWAIKKGKKGNTSWKGSFGYPRLSSGEQWHHLRIYRLGSKCFPEQNTKSFLPKCYKLQCAITLTEKKGLFWENKNLWWQKNLISLKNDGCKKMWQGFRQQNILTWADL